MSNIIRTQNDFLSFISDETTEGGNLSIRGVARCCSTAHTSIIRDGAFASGKLGQILMESGFDAGALAEDGFPPQAVWLCIEYFAYESKAKAPMAKQLARTFGSIGVTTTLEQLRKKPDLAADRQLPPIRDAIEYQQAIAALPSITNPILRAALEQRFAEELGATKMEKESNLVLAAVLARDLGYKLEPGQDAKLGTFVRKYHKPAGKVQHGRYQVNAYDRSEILDSVHAFFR